MIMTIQPYKKSLSDEIDFKVVDQLHSAVSQFSSFCFEIKKFCVTTIFIVLTFLTKFTNNQLDWSLFISCFLMILFFWSLDSTSYYYQVKLRGLMNSRIKEIEKRNSNNGIKDHKGDVIIDSSRTEKSFIRKALNSLFNPSMSLYYGLFLINIISVLLFKYGYIK